MLPLLNIGKYMAHTATLHRVTISNRGFPFLDRIMDGTKTVEARTYSRWFREMKPGDEMELYNNNSWVLCQIKARNVYDSFKEMLTVEGLEKVLPGYKGTIDDAVKLYHKFPRFPENEKTYGVVAFQLEKVRSGSYAHRRYKPY